MRECSSLGGWSLEPIRELFGLSEKDKTETQSLRDREDHEEYEDQSRRFVRLKTRRRRMWVTFLCFLTLSALLALMTFSVEYMERSEALAPVETPELESPPAPPVLGEGLESRLLDISSDSPGDYGVAVFDARSGQTIQIEADRDFVAASLAKLPVFLTLYKEAADGDLSLDEKIEIQPTDVIYEGAGVLQNYPIGYEMTLRDCAGFLIKESDNTAWMMLQRRLGEAEIFVELSSLDLDPLDYTSRTTTPRDVMVMLQKISAPEHTSPELSREMLQMMTDTSFEQRLPEPLPDDVSVAHKVGTLDGTYSDAGIVFDDTDGDYLDAKDAYYIVVISSDANQDEARETIQQMSLAAYEELR